MSNTQLTYIRSGATAAITGLAVLYSYFPHDVWITAIISAAATLGIHAIPAIQQGVTQLVPQIPVPKGTVTVSEQPEATPEVAEDVAPQHNPPTAIDGLALMGLRAPVTDSGQAEAAPPASVPEAPEVAPAPVSSAPTGTPPVSAAQLRDLANFLENL